MSQDQNRNSFSKAELVAKAAAISVPAVIGVIPGGALGAIVAAAGGELTVEGVRRVFGRLDEARRERAAVPMAFAALSVNAAPDELFERIEHDPKLAALAYSATVAAAESTMVAKIIALGQFVAEAVSDPTRVDQEQLFVDALRPLGEPHVAVLSQLRPASGMRRSGRSLITLRQGNPNLGYGLESVLHTLESGGLISEQTSQREVRETPRIPIPGVPRSPNGPTTKSQVFTEWMITDFGIGLLKRLEAAHSEASAWAGTPVTTD